MKNKYSILYVDDEESNLRTFKNVLRRDYKILIAKSGEEGLKILEENQVDLIVTDQRMPEMTGIEFLQKVLNKHPDPNRILLTGFTDFDAIKNAVNTGKIFQYVQKPWEIDELKPVIDKAIEAYYLKKDNEKLKNELLEKNNSLNDFNAKLEEEIDHKNLALEELQLSQQELGKSEKRFRDISYNIADWIWEVDLNGHYTYSSGKVMEIMGYEPNELIGITPFDLMSVEDAKKVSNIFKEYAKKQKSIIELETWQIRKDGERVCLLTSGVPLFNENNQHVGYRGVNKDITDRRKIQEKIRQQNIFLNQVIDSLTHPFYVIDTSDYTIQLANSAAKNKTEIKGRTCYSITHNIDKPCFLNHENCPLKIVLETKKPTVIEHIHYDKNNIPNYFEVHAFPLFNDKGEVHQMIEYSININDRKKAEEKIKKSEARLKEAQNLAKLGNWELNLQTNTLYWSDEIYRIFNIDKNHFKPTYEAFIEYIHPDDRELISKTYEKLIKNHKPYEIDHRIQIKDGTIKYVHRNCYSEINNKNETIKIMGTIQDITEKKLAEIELQMHKEKLEDIVKERTAELKDERDIAQNYLDVAGVIIMVLDENQDIKLINKKGAETLGYDNESELIGLNWYDNFIPENTRKKRRQSYGEIFSEEVINEAYIENVILTKTGKKKLIAWKDITLKNHENKIIGLLSSGEDITTRRENEKALIERTKELEMFNKTMIGRELKIIELKEEINALAAKLNKDIPYPAVWNK